MQNPNNAINPQGAFGLNQESPFTNPGFFSGQQPGFPSFPSASPYGQQNLSSHPHMFRMIEMVRQNNEIFVGIGYLGTTFCESAGLLRLNNNIAEGLSKTLGTMSKEAREHAAGVIKKDLEKSGLWIDNNKKNIGAIMALVDTIRERVDREEKYQAVLKKELELIEMSDKEEAKKDDKKEALEAFEKLSQVFKECHADDTEAMELLNKAKRAFE